MDYYSISKGSHYNNERKIIKVPDRIDFEFYVHESLIHDTSYNVGWSKLIGITKGFNNHKNSAKIAWRCPDSTNILVAGYFYLKGDRIIYNMGSVEVGSWHTGSVWYDNDTFYVQVGDSIISQSGYNTTSPAYLTHPYFGGVKPAPHKMHFYFNFF